jgi:hypothetical protein
MTEFNRKGMTMADFERAQKIVFKSLKILTESLDGRLFIAKNSPGSTQHSCTYELNVPKNPDVPGIFLKMKRLFADKEFETELSGLKDSINFTKIVGDTHMQIYVNVHCHSIQNVTYNIRVAFTQLG